MERLKILFPSCGVKSSLARRNAPSRRPEKQAQNFLVAQIDASFVPPSAMPRQLWSKAQIIDKFYTSNAAPLPGLL
jgi:hypothetical protein